MPLTDSPSFLNIISMRRNQVVSLDSEQDTEDLDLFQRHVADRFSDLVPPADSNSSDPILSIAWLRKLLDLFLCCEAEFKALILFSEDPSIVVKPPMDRLVPEMLERTVKALDVCNAAMHGIEPVRHCQRLAEIAVAALEQRPLGDGQAKRARKALASLLTSLTVEDKETVHRAPERAWSFGRRGGGGCPAASKGRNACCAFRPSTWSVSKTWSAARQIQAMTSNLAPPRWGETSPLATPVYMMNSVMVFAMWALVAAIPCQDRNGLPTSCPIPRQLGWAQSIISMQDRIGEEWKKKEKRGSAGLMEEMQKLEKLGNSLLEFTESFQFPGDPDKVEAMAAQVSELSETCYLMEVGLRALQQQIREVFHRIVRSRNEIVDAMDQASKLSISNA